MHTHVIIGGSGGIGREIAERFAQRGDDVTITSRDSAKADAVAKEIGGHTRGLAVDLARPETIEAALASIETLDHLVITAIEQAANSVASLSLPDALRATTTKLIGYLEAAHVLQPRFTTNGAIVLFGGLAKERPYPGSTIVTTTNAGISGLIRTLAMELAPIRVNALHPGLVGDSPQWRNRPHPPQVTHSPIGRPVTMTEVATATEFLLTNQGINAIDLHIDGGQRIT